MRLMRLRSLKRSLSNFSVGWLNERRRASDRSPLKVTCADKRFAKLSVRSSNTASPSVVDFLEVNAELPYTTVVEGLEEFLYQSELQPRW